MDENDKILKEYISSKSDYSVPFSFPEKIIARIGDEKNKRARIHEYLQITSVIIGAAALLIFSFSYLNVNYFKIDLDDLKLAGNSDIKNSLFKMKTLIFNKDAITWYIIAFNTALLIIVQQLLQNKFYGKKIKN